MDWQRRLLRPTPQGKPFPIVKNAIVPLRYAPEWKGVLGFDQNKMQTVFLKSPPWSTIPTVDVPARAVEDLDDVLTAQWMQENYIYVGREIARQAIEVQAHENVFHPILEYLLMLKWDGTKRISEWLSVYLGAQNSRYNSIIGRKFLLSAVARIMVPGSKNDYCLMLEGPQGARKSTALEVLAVNPAWHTDDLPRLTSKDAKLHLHGFWIVEIGELAAMRGLDSAEIKAFISRRRDDYRPPYGVHTIEVPRQCVFVGTVNRPEYLNDETGGRRFLPVAAGNIDIEALRRDRDQLWAEAVVAFEENEPWWPDVDDPEIVREQEQRDQQEPWADLVEDYLRKLRGPCSITEILEKAIKKPLAEWKHGDRISVGKIITNLKGRPTRPRGNSRQRHYGPPPDWKWSD